MFKRWSEQEKAAKEMMSPDLGFRDWNELSPEEKEKIFQYIKFWFEDKKNSFLILITAIDLNESHKTSSYARHTLKEITPTNAEIDLRYIFLNEDGHVVLEMLSIYAENIIKLRSKETGDYYRHNYKSDSEYEERLNKWRWAEFDIFTERINNVFEQFGINLFITRKGFVGRQEKKITEDIYVPVLKVLSLENWKEVNRELSDSFREYQKKTDYGYSHSITHSISAVQAFLQILVDGKIGGSDGISKLITSAQEKDLIPNDKFSKTIFKNIDAILMRERGLSGDAHPKTEYANENNARLVMNLVMVFIQHCLQK